MRVETGARSLAGAIAILVVFSSAGCAQSAEHGRTLAESKTPTQLLRNVAADRLSHMAPGVLDSTVDLSTACGDPSTDPDELMRAWLSTAGYSLDPGVSSRAVEISTDLANSYLDDGWSMDESVKVSDAEERTLLLSKDKHTSIEIRLLYGLTESHREARVEVSVTGECVLTDGPNSDEVRRLQP